MYNTMRICPGQTAGAYSFSTGGASRFLRLFTQLEHNFALICHLLKQARRACGLLFGRHFIIFLLRKPVHHIANGIQIQQCDGCTIKGFSPSVVIAVKQRMQNLNFFLQFGAVCVKSDLLEPRKVVRHMTVRNKGVVFRHCLISSAGIFYAVAAKLDSAAVQTAPCNCAGLIALSPAATRAVTI